LLEVLISLFIFSVGFLGLASLQHVAMQLTHDSVLHNTAINLAESLITRIRVEGDSLNISDWQSDVNKNLPDGKGNLLKQGEDYTLTLQWQESPHSANGSAGHQYSRSFKSAH
jgi:Tfp pilus assembly protein PilV